MVWVVDPDSGLTPPADPEEDSSGSIEVVTCPDCGQPYFRMAGSDTEHRCDDED